MPKTVTTTTPLPSNRNQIGNDGFVARVRRIHWGIYPLVVVFAIVAFIAVPHFGSADNIRNIIEQSAVLAVLTAAEVLVLFTGRFDLSLESTVGFAPMVAAIVVTQLAIPSPCDTGTEFRRPVSITPARAARAPAKM